ncbi:uncharacterized protein NPIL_85921 [Nephila pilipes]|uniref:Retrotransposon gag domain-containing protein n=1 Tax=Nephila pilipes TaxID=299642 RepID=A0A8X6UT95_NEPPI|nr:uncharacterized protein NPIL_85921 [Nephila pilipes]
MSIFPSNPSPPSDQLFSQWRPTYPNPEIGVGSSFRVLPEIFFSGRENVSEFLDNIDYGVMFYEIPVNLICAYLKCHLIGKARDWFEVIGSSYVTGTATDFAQLKRALTNSFPVVRNRSELEAEFYSSHQVRSQAPSDFVYKLLKIQKILNFEMTEEKLLNHIIMRLSPQVMDYVEVRNPTIKAELLQLVEKEITLDWWYVYRGKENKRSPLFVDSIGSAYPVNKSVTGRVVLHGGDRFFLFYRDLAAGFGSLPKRQHPQLVLQQGID